MKAQKMTRKKKKFNKLKFKRRDKNCKGSRAQTMIIAK